MSTRPGTSVAPFPESSTAPVGGALLPAGVMAAIRPFSTSTSRALVRSPFTTSSTATSAIQTVLGFGEAGATRNDGAGLMQAARTAAARAAQAERMRRVTVPPGGGAPRAPDRRGVRAGRQAPRTTPHRIPRVVVWAGRRPLERE